MVNEIFKGLAELSRVDSILALYVYVLKHNCKIISCDELDANRYTISLTSDKTIRFSTPVSHHGINKGRATTIVLTPKGIE